MHDASLQTKLTLALSGFSRSPVNVERGRDITRSGPGSGMER